MALDRRELLRRIGMGGLGAALSPQAMFAGIMPPRSDGMIALPVSQEIGLVPREVITPDLVHAANFDGWYLVSATINASRDCLTHLDLSFVQEYYGGDSPSSRLGAWGRRDLDLSTLGLKEW